MVVFFILVFFFNELFLKGRNEKYLLACVPFFFWLRLVSTSIFPFNELLLLGVFPSSNTQDPKRKVHKPVKGVLRLEIEKHQTAHTDLENLSESGSGTNDSIDPGDYVPDSTFTKCPSNGSDEPQTSGTKWNNFDGKEISGSLSNARENADFTADDVSVTPFLCIDL